MQGGILDKKVECLLIPQIITGKLLQLYKRITNKSFSQVDMPQKPRG